MRPSFPILAAMLAVSLGGLGCKKLMSGGGDAGEPSGSAGGPLGAALSFLGGFEGEIDAFVKESKPPGTSTPLAVFVKSGKLRLDVPEKFAESARGMLGPKAYVIFDSAAKKLYIVSDAQKQVIVVDLNKTGEQLKGIGSPPAQGHPGTPGQSPPKVTKTGKWDTVAGYKCENWEIASDHREGSVCVAQEGVSWFSIPMTGIPTEHLWMAELLDGKHFPLRFVGYDKDGVTEGGRMEITKIDKKTLPASDFEYPPAYRVVDLAQLFQGFGGMPGGIPGGLPGGMAPHPPHGKPH